MPRSDRKRLKRGGNRRRQSLDLEGLVADDVHPDDLIDLDHALNCLLRPIPVVPSWSSSVFLPGSRSTTPPRPSVSFAGRPSVTGRLLVHGCFESFGP